MKEIKIKNKMAFTLAETLIALVILGIIAAVTIPTLIRNHVDNANRAKVKKAMTMYEKALNNMIIENDLRSTDAIKTFGGLPDNAVANTNDCEDTVKYFKTVEGANCRFKTADGVWWDITDITNPIIILDSKILIENDDLGELQGLAQGDNKFVYGMVGRYEDDKGILRINDNAYEDQHGSTAQKAEVAKLWDFINNQTSGGNAGGEGGGDEPTYAFGNCAVTDDTHCTIGTTNYTKYSITSTDIETAGVPIVTSDEGFYFCSYEKNSDGTWGPETCDNVTSTASTGDIYISDVITLSSSEAYEEENCNEAKDPEFCEEAGDYWILAKRKCLAQGARLATAAELKILNSKSALSSGEYWASEASQYGKADGYYFDTSNGKVIANSSDASRKAVCVSN